MKHVTKLSLFLFSVAQLSIAVFLFLSCSKSKVQTPASRKAPVVIITNTSFSDNLVAPANITLTVNATDEDGTISKVEFYAGTVKIGESVTSPFSFAWANIQTGTYIITAKATDNNGLSSTSAPVTITIKGDSRTAVEKFGQLQIRGTNMIDKNKQPVQLRGMSFFWSQWIGGYYNGDVVKWLANDWKVTVVRASMAIDNGGYLTNPATEKAKVMAVVDAAIQQGIYVLVDWHEENAQLHTTQEAAFFSELAQKYGNSPNIIYEIWNEPLNVNWSSVIKPHADTIINAIRKFDPNNIIVVGTPNWSQDVDKAALDPLPYSNIAYTLHYYASTHRQSLRDKATAAMSKGIALFVTEFGTSEASGSGNLDAVETKTWWDFLDQNKISWCNWSLSDKAETSAALMPGASTAGGWTDAQISPSGKIVRAELRLKNP